MVTRPRNLQQADPYFDSVVFLAPFSGEDAATSSTDLSNSGHTLTFNGTAALDSDQRKFGFTSLLLDGDSDYLTAPNSTDFDFGTDLFTIECHVRFASAPGPSDNHNFISLWDADGVSQRAWRLGIEAQKFTFINTTNGVGASVNIRDAAGSGWTPAANTWYHVAVVRDTSGVHRAYVDGVQLTTDTDTVGVFDSNSTLDIGFLRTATGPDYWMDGWIENVRITKGVCRYPDGTTFTPPERAYPTVQNVDGVFQLPDTSTITYETISSSLSAAGYIVDFVWNEDGTKWIFTDDGSGGAGTGEILYADVSTPYDISTLSTVETPIDTTLGRLRGIQWSADGTQLYVTDYSTGDISSFGASPAYDITSVGTTPDTTISLLGNSTLLGMHFTDDGKYLIVGTTTSTAWLYPLSTAWDISTIGTGQSANLSASGVTRSDQLIISNDGTRIWQLGLNTEDIHQWTLTTPFDLSTASWDGAGKDFALQDSGSYVNPTGMTIHPTNRNELYVTWTLSSYRIQKYTIG